MRALHRDWMHCREDLLRESAVRTAAAPEPAQDTETITPPPHSTAWAGGEAGSNTGMHLDGPDERQSEDEDVAEGSGSDVHGDQTKRRRCIRPGGVKEPHVVPALVGAGRPRRAMVFIQT